MITIKKISIYTLILIIFSLFAFILFYGIKLGSFSSAVKKLIPEKVSTLLKSPRKIKDQEQRLRKLNADLVLLNSKFEYLNGTKVEKKITSKLGINYELIVQPIPFPGYNAFEGKPVGYIDVFNEDLLLASGTGEFYYSKISDLNSKLIVNKIETNLKKVIRDPQFFHYGKPSVRDIFIDDENLYVGHIKTIYKKGEACYNTAILEAKINFSYLEFKEFFSFDECGNLASNNEIYKQQFRLDLVGGRVTKLDNDHLLLTTGPMGDRPKAQNKDSLFGKILSINMNTKEYRIVSMGHRNPQGLYYDKEKKILFSTEHGPKGGDEVNLNIDPFKDPVENFGWPISSYGVHYNGKFYEEAPLNKSHSNFGFVEPIKYFTPSVGISQIFKVHSSFDSSVSNAYFVAALGYPDQLDEGDRHLHKFKWSDDFKEIIEHDQILINERIRDLIYIPSLNVYAMILDKPALALLSKN